MSVTIAFQDYMAGWDLARELLLDLGLSIISTLLESVVPKSVSDDMTMGLRECLKTAQLMGEVPMASIQLFC
jgi:hypothetical protein